MSREIINTDKSPLATHLYSQAIRANGVIYLSGLIGFTVERKFAGDSVQEQTEQIFKNLHAVLEAAGSNVNKVVKVTIYLLTMNDYQTVNELYQKVFGQSPPARTCIAVSELPLGAKIELEAIALV